MAYMLLGIALLALALLAARWFAKADTKTLVTMVKWVGGTLAVLLAVFLVTRGLGLTALGALVPLLFMFRRVRNLGHLFSGLGRAQPSAGQRSSVETAYLDMTLDHDSGAIDGTVRRGPLARRPLNSLTLDELLDLLAECARADQESARLLEAYLDRSPHSEWRERMQARERGADARAKGAMTVEEARQILGVGPEASAAEIKEAHRHLMQVNHPDHGGSSYLAAKINLAKEVLLRGA